MMAVMRHARFDVATLSIEGIPIELKAAYLLVAQPEGSDELQWECLAYALAPAPVAEGRYQVAITTLHGRELSGDAVLVRSVEGAHVLRGAGPLAGLRPDDLG